MGRYSALTENIVLEIFFRALPKVAKEKPLARFSGPAKLLGNKPRAPLIAFGISEIEYTDGDVTVSENTSGYELLVGLVLMEYYLVAGGILTDGDHFFIHKDPPCFFAHIAYVTAYHKR